MAGLTQDEYARLRQLCYKLFRPQIADKVASVVVEAQCDGGTLDEFALGTTLLRFLEDARQGSAAKFAYSLVSNGGVGRSPKIITTIDVIRKEFRVGKEKIYLWIERGAPIYKMDNQRVCEAWELWDWIKQEGSRG